MNFNHCQCLQLPQKLVVLLIPHKVQSPRYSIINTQDTLTREDTVVPLKHNLWCHTLTSGGEGTDCKDASLHINNLSHKQDVLQAASWTTHHGPDFPHAIMRKRFIVVCMNYKCPMIVQFWAVEQLCRKYLQDISTRRSMSSATEWQFTLCSVDSLAGDKDLWIKTSFLSCMIAQNMYSWGLRLQYST